MDDQTMLFGLEMALRHRKLDYAVGLGFSGFSETNVDSLDIKFSRRRYSLRLGYQLLRLRRLWVTQRAGLHWMRQRLVNTDHRRTTGNGGLDVRFGQAYLSATLDISYRFRWNGGIYDHWSVGAYCGYITTVNPVPKVNVKSGRSVTAQRTDLVNINLGVYVAIGID
jgi:hypothetical protein